MSEPLPRPKKYQIGLQPAAVDPDVMAMMAQLETTMLGHILYWGNMDRGIQANRQFAPRTVGRALTVQCPGPDSTILHHAIGLAEPGDILAIDRLGDQVYACLGDGVAAAARQAGIVAAIIDGPCTDSVELEQMGFPVWCRGTSPITTRLLDLAGRAQLPISCGGVSVSAGDVILADSDGVFALSPDEAKEAGAIALKRGEIVAERRKKRPKGLLLGEMTGATSLVEAELSAGGQAL